MHCRVSVVIPSYNHKKYIGRAIDSVLAQTWPDVEVVVIDDGSSDGSYDFIRENYGRDTRVKASRRENRGAHATINEAIEASSGEFVAILNSDDFYEPERLAALVEAARSQDGPFFGITALNVVDSAGDVFRSSGYNAYYDMLCGFIAEKPDIYGLWCGNIAITTSNFFFSRSVYDEVGPFRALRYAHDWDFALRASAKFGLRRLERKLVSYRIHGENTILERDHWAHVVEDAFVCASALRGQKFRGDDADLFGALNRNWGFRPLPTLYLLADARSEAEQLDGIANGALKQEMRAALEGSLTDPVLFEQVPAIEGALKDRRVQSKALERCEARLAAIRKSKSWKIFGWLWRLETRKARKSPAPEQQRP